MVTKETKITSCYIGPKISPENFVVEHYFLYLAKGTMYGYDGEKNYTLNAGECCLIRKNNLARYSKQKAENNDFEKVIVIFDELFLKLFQEKHNIPDTKSAHDGPFIAINRNDLIPNFLHSINIYFNSTGAIDQTFMNVKREELLLILLKNNPELKEILFDFGIPQKIDIEAFMNRNFKFNVSMERFAYLTGRSISTFKRDFSKIFNTTPYTWLIQKRLKEAHFLIEKKKQKPSDVYIEVGFEDLSHFSISFKKQFGYNPSELR
jgi:AraC family transcriptional regulator, exoenzyme S synthesis regulatory protein ExsA